MIPAIKKNNAVGVLFELFYSGWSRAEWASRARQGVKGFPPVNSRSEGFPPVNSSHPPRVWQHQISRSS